MDASNAFNNLNRRVALYNIQYVCPAVAKILINCYRNPACLFVGSTVLLSREGTTQGDPLAMMMFGLATLPLIKAVKTLDTVQCWFADDAGAGGSLKRLRIWWDLLNKIGPLFGYFPHAAKSFLLVKSEKYDEAVCIFRKTDVEITCTGRRYLGGALGSREFELNMMNEKVIQWVLEIEQLAKIGQTQPHAAFAAFTHGLLGRWSYAMRVAAVSADEVLQPLEEAISQVLIPALTMQPAPSKVTRDLFACLLAWVGWV